MRLLVGLGNPGVKFDATRHNAGFWVLDSLAAKQGAHWEQWRGVQTAIVPGGKLCKPQEFMNISGKSLAEYIRFFQLPLEDICVVSDDVYLKPGTVRVRQGGGDGGHNGLKSFLQHLPDTPFLQVRVGVGLYAQTGIEREQQPPLDEYVLRPQAPEDQKNTLKAIDELLPDLVGWLATGEIACTTRHLAQPNPVISGSEA